MTFKSVLYIILLAAAIAGVWAVFKATDSGKNGEKLQKRFGKSAEHAVFLFRSVAVCLVIEIFVFNFNATHLLNGNYVRRTLEPASASVSENFDAVTRTNIAAGLTSLEFYDIDAPLGTLTIYGESSRKSTVIFAIDMSDDTFRNGYRTDIASMQVIQGNKQSATIPCNFSGNVYNLRIRFYPEEGETVTITGIEMNKPIGIHFSMIRFLIMLLGSIAVYALSSGKLLRQRYELKRKAVNIIAWCFTLCLIVFSTFLTNMYRYTNPNHDIFNDFKSTGGNQISQEIVDAFEAGRVDLGVVPDERLTSLDNPYDGSQRADIPYLWDHLLFEGKYYSYYGIAPVLTLFLPYHMLTGYYFPGIWAVWMFGVIGIIFLTMFYLCFSDKFFRQVNASLVLVGLAIIQFSTGIYFNYYAANFYEIAQASGFMWTAAGAYFMISSNVIGGKKIKNGRLAASSACLSTAVLCRPTLAVYCVAALIFIYAGFKKKKRDYAAVNAEKPVSKAKYYTPYLLCALLPFALIGSIQVWYNWVRFGNPLDFGIQYSLTINDFTQSQFHTHFSLLGIYSYILAYPEFSERFPFLVAGYPRTFDPQGYYFIATGAAMGLLWRALPVTAYAKSRQAYRVSDNPDKRLYALLTAAVCIVCPAVIIFSIWESGYGTRYCVDFAWQLIIGSLIICFTIYTRCRKNTQQHLNNVMIGAGFVSLAVNFAQIYTYVSPLTNFNTEWQAKVLSFARLFEFWR